MDREVAVGHVARRQLEDMLHDLLHVDILTALLGKVLVNDRNRKDAVDALLQRGLDVLRLRAAGLQPQQACNRLQIVLDAMVNLLDDGGLDADLLVLGPRIRHIGQNDDAHLRRAAFLDDNLAADEDESARRDLLLPGPIALNRLAHDVLRELPVEEMTAAQAADTEHPVDALGRRIGKDNAAVRIRQDDAVARRDGMKLFGVERASGILEHHDGCLQEMQVAVNRELVGIDFKVQHTDDFVSVVYAKRVHVDHRAVIPLALAAAWPPGAEGILHHGFLDAAHDPAHAFRLARHIDGMRTLLRDEQERILLSGAHIDLEFSVGKIGHKRKNHRHAHQKTDLHDRKHSMPPAQ